MELIELGMDHWFKAHADDLCQPKQRIARVTAVDRGQCIIRNSSGEVPAKATGTFMHSVQSPTDMPCVGDWVCVEYPEAEDSASIHAVLPRKSFLRRKAAGKSLDFQMIAANIDAAFIVISCHYDFNLSRLERYLVMAGDGRVEPLLVLTKTDLVSAAELEQLILRIREVGISARIMAISNVTGAGLDQVKAAMSFGKTYCLVGSSGVGKSTLINQLTGQETVKTGTVSKSGEGRHTTVRRHLIILEQGAMLIDTPGMREVGILVASEEMEDNFDDIQQLSPGCRFTNCGHTNEPGCAVLEAIAKGTLQQQHYQNYIKLKTESALNETLNTDQRKTGKRA
ncbi:MAG: ribosome small subunit-dependent GTPase A [Desulfobulbaceae bacterium]|jgi:ribosome biogenesis GTPase|nr:ribosome small subunit-dependent GTPase A [Desulfobulbaceae bacterium]